MVVNVISIKVVASQKEQCRYKSDVDGCVHLLNRRASVTFWPFTTRDFNVVVLVCLNVSSENGLI